MSSTALTTRLHLIRHGEVEARYQKVFGGRIDMDLSPVGHQQAVSLGEHFSETKFDAIYVSPMRRAQQTLAPIAAQQTIVPVTLHGLREVDFGAWTGLSWEQVNERFGVSAFDWLDMLDRAAIPDAEDTRVFRARVEPCLQQILQECPGKEVAVVCHGGVIRMLLSILLDLPITKTAQFEIEYAGVTVVEHQPRLPRLQLLNFTPWG